MTKVMEGVKVLTFEEWMAKPEVKALEAEADECDECNGTGEHECSCGHVHDCAACEGVGKSIDMRVEYEKALRNEIVRLQAWREGRAVKAGDLPRPDRMSVGYERNPKVVLMIGRGV